MKVVMTVADLDVAVAWGQCRIYEILGFNPNVGDLYIQLFDQITALATGNVPTQKSILAQGNNGFKYSFDGGLPLSCLRVGVSSTEPTYTAAANGLDMTLDVQTACDFTGVTIAGDLSNQRSRLAVWADNSAARHKLLRVDVRNTSGNDVMMGICGVTGGLHSLEGYTKVGAGVTGSYDFGPEGYMPKGISNDAEVYACDVFLATLTGGYLTLPVADAPAASLQIRALYR